MRPWSSTPRALVIDDSAETRAIYTLILRLEGFTVRETCSGADAVERTLESRPDIIVTDLSMVMMDGGDTIRRLRTHRRTHRVPIVLCSGLDGVPGLEWPWSDELPLKPYSLDVLMIEVRRRLARPALIPPITAFSTAPSSKARHPRAPGVTA
jgi:DNA-binding response OmpR family regulator